MQTWLPEDLSAKSLGCYFIEPCYFGGRSLKGAQGFLGLFKMSYLLFISKNPSTHPSMILIHNPSSSNYKVLLVVRPLTKKRLISRETTIAGSHVCFFVEGIFPRQIHGPTPSSRRWMQWLLLFGELSKLSGWKYPVRNAFPQAQLLMDEIWLTGWWVGYPWLSHYLPGFGEHVRWCYGFMNHQQ